MLPGPVFNVELLTTARRPRYYGLRGLYGLLLLLVVWQNYANWDRGRYTSLNPAAMRSFAGGTFASIVVLQGIVVLAMTPALIAGVIAEERQRQTLHYLMASRLTSREIIIGKLAARMLHVAVFLAIGLPIITLLSLFGGVDPIGGLVSTAATFTTAFFLASVSVLCSTIAKRVREALTLAYSVEGAWLFLPLLARHALSLYMPEFYSYIRPVNDWVWSSSPMALTQLSLFAGTTGLAPIISATLWMMGLQIAGGLILIALAIWRLRPAFKVHDGAIKRRILGVTLPGNLRRVRLFDKTPVSDHAMLWKEMQTSRTSGGAQILAIVTSVLIFGAIAYWTWDFARDAIVERWKNPFNPMNHTETVFGWSLAYPKRTEFNLFIRWITTSIAVVSILAAAVSGANSMTSEREEDTWISLTATPLGGFEIVGAKMVGTMWKARWGASVLMIQWVVGVFAGAVHPMGVMFQAIEFMTYLVFATALGTFISVRSKSTWKAQSVTVATLGTLSGGYLAMCCPLMIQGRGSYLYYLGVMPFQLAMAPLTPWEFYDTFTRKTLSVAGHWTTPQIVVGAMIGTGLYAVAALILATGAILSFDAAAERPRR